MSLEAQPQTSKQYPIRLQVELSFNKRIGQRVVWGLLLHQCPQDVQEFVHQNAQGLHFGQRVLLSLLEMLIELGKALIDPDQA